MLNVKEIRKDFPLLNNVKEMQGQPFVYFDNASTSLKPKCVIDAMTDYYCNYGVNAHRGDYDLAAITDKKFEDTRKLVADFINATPNNIIFTSGTTGSLNLVANGYGFINLTKDDEIILNELEHASNLLPWYKVAERVGAKVIFAPVSKKGNIDVESIKSVLTSKTKIISIAYVGNVLGQENEVKDIIKLAHANNILVCVDAAQAAPHKKIDVIDLDCDFLAFSGHKMCGPTGVGVLYVKKEIIAKMQPVNYGGGMNAKFDKTTMSLVNPPFSFEGGTPAIAEIIGLGVAIKYLNSIGMDNIEAYEHELKAYAINKLKELDNVDVYNAYTDSAIIDFNIKKVFCQDAGSFFNSKGIAVRSGHHCAKLIPSYLGVYGTVRASLYFYNTKEEIDQFVEACKHGEDFLDAIFK